MPTPAPASTRQARGRHRAVAALALVASLSACDAAGISGVSDLPCISCLVTTHLEIQGDSVVAVGDAIVLRAVAFQQTILFDFRYQPMREAAWSSPSRTAIEQLVPAASHRDTATWGRAVVLGRSAGVATVRVRADGHEAMRYIRVVAAP